MNWPKYRWCVFSCLCAGDGEEGRDEGRDRGRETETDLNSQAETERNRDGNRERKERLLCIPELPLPRTGHEGKEDPELLLLSPKYWDTDGHDHIQATHGARDRT